MKPRPDTWWAPTWSWACLDSRVAYNAIDRATILRIISTAARPDPAGHIALEPPAEMDISAPGADAVVEYDEERSMIAGFAPSTSPSTMKPERG